MTIIYALPSAMSPARESPRRSLWPSPRPCSERPPGTGSTPGEILARLNAEICRDNESCMFVTFFCAILNIRTGQVDYSNGGHNLPYYLHRDGVSPLENFGGRALGLVEQSPYTSGRMVLSPGEALLLYTDGVTEAMDSRERLYSDQRLAQFLASNRDSSPRQIIGDLVSDVRHFAGAAPQSDDITALALHYFGTTRKNDGSTWRSSSITSFRSSTGLIRR